MHIVPNAVVDLAAAAPDHRKVGKVSAKVALVRVLHYCISICHFYNSCVAFWYLARLLN